MKHKRIHTKIVGYLEEHGNATTGEIQTWLLNVRPIRNRARGAGSMTGQSINVLSNVLRRKPIVKKGFDSTVKQTVWGVDRSR